MGCDIHAFIEYKEEGIGVYFSFAKLSLTRNYRLFGLMAGVRGGETLFKAKGIPEDIGWMAESDYTLFVSDEAYPRYTTLATATDWVARGLSKRWKDAWITSPDRHTPSWLTTEEFAKVVKKCGTPETKAVLAAMQQFSEARLVFSFDC